MANKKNHYLHCEITGEPLRYKGYGRPPKYAPGAKKEADKRRRKARRDAARAANQVPAL